MKLKRRRELRLAFVLALLAVLGTLVLAWLAYLHLCMVVHWLIVPWLRWLATPLLLQVAYFDTLFFPALWCLLAFNVTCSIGALWLALRGRG